MKKVKLYLSFTLIFLSGLTNAQNSGKKTMLVSNTIDQKNPKILIKWITEEVIMPKGVLIYRKEEGQHWKKLTKMPFKKGNYKITREEFNNDNNLDDYVAIADQVSPKELKGITKAMVLIKASQSMPYAKYLGIEYHDTTVEKGQSYQYKIMKITSSGETEIGKSQSIRVKKHIPGPPPKNIQIKAGDQAARLKWEPNKLRFLGVNVYRKTEVENAFQKITPVPIITSKRTGPDGVKSYPDIFYEDDSLKNGTTYHYKIEAMDYFGRPLELSKSYTVTPRDLKPPPSPQFLKAEVEKMNVSLTWKNRVAPDIKGYKVYRSLHHDSQYKSVHEGLLRKSIESYQEKVPQPGNYYYYVASVDSSGNEGPSFNTMAKVMDIYPPEKPRGLYTKSDTGRITLHWKPNIEEDLLGYKVYRTVNKDDESRYVLLTGTSITDTSYVDSLPQSAKNNFFYRVVAVDSSFNKSKFSDFSSNTIPDIIAPAQPFIKNVVITEKNYLEVQWIPNNDKDLLGYNIYRKNKQDSLSNNEKLNVNILSPVVDHFTDRWANPGTDYTYTLQAIDSAGNPSPFSEYFPAKLPPKDHEAAKNVIRRFRVNNRAEENVLRWRTDEQDDYLGCIIFRKEEDGPLKPINTLNKESKYKDKNIVPGTTYVYQVRAYYNKRGISRSEKVKIVVPPIENSKN